MELIRNLFIRYRNLVLYGIIGVFCTLIDYSIFYWFTNMFMLTYIFANIISVTSGLTLSFILNRTYNFKVKDQVFKRFIIFYSTGMLGLLISTGILIILIDMMEIQQEMAKVLSIVVVVMMQYLFNRFVTFKEY